MRRASLSSSRSAVARALRAHARRLPRHAQRDGRRSSRCRRSQADLGIGTDEAAWVIDAYNLVGASLLLSAGFLADRFGRKRLLCTGYALFALGAVACALAPSGGVADRVPRAAWRSAAPRSRRRASRSSPTSIPSRASAPARSASGASRRARHRARPDRRRQRSPSALGWRSVFVVNAIAGAGRAGDRPARRAALAQRGRAAHRRRRAAARDRLPGDADLRADRGAALRLRLDRASSSPSCSPACHVRRVHRRRAARPASRWSTSASSATASSPAPIFLCAATFFTFGGFIYFNALYLQDIRGYSALAAGVLSLPAAVPALIGGPALGLPRRARAGRAACSSAACSCSARASARSRSWPRTRRSAGCSPPTSSSAVGYAVLSAPVSTVAVASMPRDQAGVAAGHRELGAQRRHRARDRRARRDRQRARAGDAHAARAACPNAALSAFRLAVRRCAPRSPTSSPPPSRSSVPSSRP